MVLWTCQFILHGPLNDRYYDHMKRPLSVNEFFLFKMFSAPGLIRRGLPSLDGNIQDASAER